MFRISSPGSYRFERNRSVKVVQLSLYRLWPYRRRSSHRRANRSTYLLYIADTRLATLCQQEYHASSRREDEETVNNDAFHKMCLWRLVTEISILDELAPP
jgi:hypothetical protein